MDAEDLSALAAHAHEHPVVVIGGGIAGLVVALECAKVGMPVTVLELSERLGGAAAGVELDGLTVGIGATGWSTRGGAVRALATELGLADAIVTPREDEWIVGLPGGGHAGRAAPVPAEHILGIPANPWAEDVRRVIGSKGAWRAYLDRLRPPLTIGAERDLARLVDGRMGPRVLERLVAPLSVDGFGLRPDEVDVEVAAPGLNAALTRTGSLGGAVADLLVDAPAEPRFEGLEGGMPRLIAALRARLIELGVVIHTRVWTSSITREGDRWRVGPVYRVADADDADGAPLELDAVAAVVIAGEELESRLMLAEVLDEPWLQDAIDEGHATRMRDVVTLVLDVPALDRAERGPVIHTVPGTHAATGLVHDTARWEWLAHAAGPGRHVVRVALGSVRSDIGDGDDSPPREPSDAQIAQLAAAEASRLLDVPLEDLNVRAAHHEQFFLAPPASHRGLADRTAAVRAAVERAPGLVAVGAWLSGSGLAAVVADAREQAETVRKRALWGDGAPPS